MFKTKLNNKTMLSQRVFKAFTLIELLVVIAIIGIIAIMATVALQQARQGARDSKRVADTKQVSTALELFYNENGRYPTTEEWDSGSMVSSSTGEVFMYSIPEAPTPADGPCSSASNTYAYVPQNDGASYTIDFCTGKQISDMPGGAKQVTPGGILAIEEIEEEAPLFISCSEYVLGIEECEYNGYIYNLVQVGDQLWFAENLRTDKYNDGTEIPYAPDNLSWSNAGLASSEASSWVSVGGLLVEEYGMVYNWFAVSHDGNFDLCPVGWSVPSRQDAVDFQTYVGGNLQKTKSCCQESASQLALDACVDPVGGCSTSVHPRWNSHASYYGTNEYGFSALSAGVRWGGGSYNNLGEMARFWTRDSSDSTNSHDFSIWYTTNSSIYIRADSTRAGYSVRCLKD
ncbi:hypothetical protein CVU82_04245 [Candidatus Falkowbacteria bacterium HGW-Falkowbacteria-1]|jgi:uncharacterized protein (TIGR02145 family)/prepilin-type N-terminal cleavage/methylation domain-containing protein|uniref:Fibrobacter succinogenes major paralogous domain-containing protein n=1 Tax=Candidatus Falkowbacteria bacterium HGW-Falkowbacteria-1 TaxID=2013768 RepID=A0A2N2E956_9BACT|nr:MAG: hypothetical protein CVU82_04245 [Candidatus Falkowbacteria bacterium HGW-Falkowbacteria-1]